MSENKGKENAGSLAEEVGGKKNAGNSAMQNSCIESAESFGMNGGKKTAGSLRMNNAETTGKTAVVDIGSNSVRFMIAGADGGLNEKQLIGTVLAEGLAKTGRLNPDAEARTVSAVKHFVRLASEAECSRIYAFATEAVRAAANGADFARAVERETGVAVDVLSGAAEAEIGFAGACSDLRSPAAVIDAGGASAEIVCGTAGKILYEKSLPLGMVRLLDLCGSDRKKIRRYLSPRIREYGRIPAFGTLVGIGGTATAIGAVLACPIEYDRHAVHGKRVAATELAALEERIFTCGDVRAVYPVLSENRARMIGHGVILFSLLLGYLGADSFTVSEKDNMEGYLLLKTACI